MASKSFHALLLGGFLLVGGPLAESLQAQDENRAGPPIPADQRLRSSGNIPALTGGAAPSIVPDRAMQPTSRS
jgi:hypothetical protein